MFVEFSVHCWVLLGWWMQTLLRTEDRIVFAECLRIGLSVEKFSFIICFAEVLLLLKCYMWGCLCEGWTRFAFFVLAWISSDALDCQFVVCSRYEAKSLSWLEKTVMMFLMVDNSYNLRRWSNCRVLRSTVRVCLFQCFLTFLVFCCVWTGTGKEVLLGFELSQIGMSIIENEWMWNGVIRNVVSVVFYVVCEIELWVLNDFFLQTNLEETQLDLLTSRWHRYEVGWNRCWWGTVVFYRLFLLQGSSKY